MDVYLEQHITTNSLLQFEIGKTLELDLLTISVDYNPINENSIYFFNKEIATEVNKKNELIHSFDILIRNQANELFLGTDECNRLHLNKCTLNSFISYLNFHHLKWELEQIFYKKSIAILYYSKLKMSFCFDCDTDIHLSTIHISKEAYSL